MKTKTRRSERRASEAGLPKSVARAATAPLQDFIARDAAGRVLPFHRARRIRPAQIALDQAEEVLGAPFSVAASLRLDRALIALEHALDEAAEAES